MSFLNDLNPVQREAVEAIEGPVMIVAGAGSGKTRVLTYRTARIIERENKPEAILALTFTNKAASEMKSRIATLVGPASRAVWMGTFHSICARILRAECERIGYERNFSIYDSDDSLSLIKAIMTDRRIPQQQYSPHAIRFRISTARNLLLTPKSLREASRDPFTDKAAEVYDEYLRSLKRANAMDFDDLLLKPLELFARHPSVLEKYQYRFKYLLVDEYQDTNRVQYMLIKELGRLHRNVCVVGDDAQSIYAFRGADIRNILDFERDYPGCRIFRLEQNYRSTGTILAVADSVIRNNTRQIAKNLWTQNPQGEPVVLLASEDDMAEAARIAAQIEMETRRRKLALKDFAVLYRTNAQSRTLEDALRRAGIPYVIVGGVEFYKRKEIKDVLAYLKVLANVRDDESLLRVINVPPRSIGETTVGRVRALAARENICIFDALAHPELVSLLKERGLTAVRRFHGMLRKYLALKNKMSITELARALVDDIGILSTLKEENTPESLSRRENIQELLSALSEFSHRKEGARLEDFLEEVSLVSDVDMTDFGHNAVTLMTLHAAKGLEFGVVFIAGLEEGLFPIADAVEHDEELEEERRLFYVGITRAMKKLYLSYANTRYRFGERSYSVRSRFLDEVDERYVTVEATPQRRPTMPYRRPQSVPAPVRSNAGAGRRETGGEYLFGDVTPRYEDESQETQEARVGARVIHEAFGRGKVVAVTGSGENARAVVDFESVGRKHLMLKYAHLRSG